MNYWKSIAYRWDKEEFANWSSMRKTAYLLLPLLIYYAVHDFSQILLWALFELFISSGGEGFYRFAMKNAYTVQGIVGGITILLGTAAVWAAVKQEISGEEQSERERTEKILLYLLSTVTAFCAAIGFNLLFARLGITQSSQTFSRVQDAQYGVQFVIGLLLYGMVSPFAEEAIFRGLLYNRMKRCFGYPVGLLGSSLLFGLYHGNLVQGIYGFLLGLLIAYAYERCKSFGIPVLIHGVANAAVYTMTYKVNIRPDGYMELVSGILLLFIGAVSLFFIRKKTEVKER